MANQTINFENEERKNSFDMSEIPHEKDSAPESVMKSEKADEPETSKESEKVDEMRSEPGINQESGTNEPKQENVHTQEKNGAGSGEKENFEHGKEFHGTYNEQQSKKEQEEAEKSIAEQLRNLLRRLFARIKRAAERFIGRNQIPNWFRARAVDFANIRNSRSSKDERESADIDKNEKEKRNWRNLMYHGFARRVLGKDAYMYAVKQGEKENTPEPKENPFKKDRADGAARMDAGETRTQTTGKEAPKETAPVNRTETKETTKPVTEKEEMKGKFNSLHKMITMDLEDRYSNAAELKDTFFKDYCHKLENEFEKITEKDNIKVTHERENGILRIKIADTKDQFGEYINLLGVTKISIEMDSHLNIRKAEGIIIDRMSPEGKIQSSRTVDLSDSIGKYVVSKLAENFREDYNTSDRAFNVTSRNEFINELIKALENKETEIKLDNISYTIAENEKSIVLTSEHSGKTYEIDQTFFKTDDRTEELLTKNLEKEKEVLTSMESQRDSLARELKEKINIAREAETLIGNLKASRQMIQIKQRTLENDIRKGKAEPEAILAMNKELETVTKQMKDNYKEISKAEQSFAVAKAQKDIFEKNYREMSERVTEQREKISSLEEAKENSKINRQNSDVQKTIDELHKDHVVSVSYERKDVIRSVEELLPTLKSENSISNMGLEEFNHIAESTKTLYNELMEEHGKDIKPELVTDKEIPDVTIEVEQDIKEDPSIKMNDVGETEIGSER